MSSPEMSVPCALCGAQPGEPCMVKRDPSRPTYPHTRRWDTARARLRSGTWLARLRRSDPRFRLQKGDILVMRAYRLDPEKGTVLQRLSDGFEPHCNQYVRDVEFLQFIDTGRGRL